MTSNSQTSAPLNPAAFRIASRIIVLATICMCSVIASAQQPTGLAAVPDKVFIVADRANLSAYALFSLVNFDTATRRVLSLSFLGDQTTLSLQAESTPFEVQPTKGVEVRVDFRPNGDTSRVSAVLIAVSDNAVTGERDTLSIPVEASIGPPEPIDTIRLMTVRSTGLIPNTIRYTIILDSDIKDDVGFAEVLFKYDPDQLYLGEYTVLTDSSDDEWEYTGLRVVPDDNRMKGDTIADFHFTILHGTDEGGDTNSMLELLRVEWFKKFTGNQIYTYTYVNGSIVSDVAETDEAVGTDNSLSLNVFPNPATSLINITLKSSGSPISSGSLASGGVPIKIALYTAEGIECADLTNRAVLTSEPVQLNGGVRLNGGAETMRGVTITTSLPSVASGMYYVRAITASGSVARAVVIR